MTPSPFAQIVTVASYEIRKYIRGRRLLGMLILLALIVGLFVGLPPALGIKYATTPDAFVSTFASFSGLLVVLGGVLFAAGSHVFVRPDARAQVVFSGPTRVLGLFTLNFGYRF